MKHGYIVLFDHEMRKAWFSNVPWPLSEALHASARIGSQLRAKEVK